MENLYLIFDIGGTKTLVGLFIADNPQPLSTCSIKTPNETCGEYVKENIPEILTRELFIAAKDILGGKNPNYILFGFPGVIPDEDELYDAPTIWGVPLKKPLLLKQIFNNEWPSAKISIINDVLAAAYRYTEFFGNFCLITISSGIGCKVFIDGKPVLDNMGIAGEIGHIRVDFSENAPSCDCGGKGHLGAIASGRGLLQVAKFNANADEYVYKSSLLGELSEFKVEQISTEILCRAYLAYDEFAYTIINKAFSYLANMVLTIHLITGVSHFIFMGGVSTALGDKLIKHLEDLLGEADYPKDKNWQGCFEIAEDVQSGLIGGYKFLKTNYSTASL